MFEIFVIFILVFILFILIEILKCCYYSILKTGNYEDYLKFDLLKTLKLQKKLKKGSR